GLDGQDVRQVARLLHPVALLSAGDRRVASGKGPEEHRLRLLRRVLRALTGFLVRGFPDAPGDPRSGRRDHGRVDEPGRSAPSPRRVRCSVLQDRGHRGCSRSLLRYDLVSRDRLVCSLEAWTGGAGGVRGVTGARGARALLRGGWASSGCSTSAASSRERVWLSPLTPPAPPIHVHS